MENKTQIPTEYTPYEEIVLCGNRLINVKKIVDDKGFIPILIGENKKTKRPLIWLNAKTKDGVIQLIDKSRPLINVIELNDYSNDSQIDVILDNQGDKHIILQIENLEGTPSVTKLDLRTLGYNIFGDENALNIGGNTMQQNSFQVETLIGI
nr:hypothetical protein [uncultured Allomuricauda sp.]